jgi:homoserine dehydrogenase
MLTHRVREARMNQALARIAALEAVQGEIVRIRMETLAG